MTSACNSSALVARSGNRGSNEGSDEQRTSWRAVHELTAKDRAKGAATTKARNAKDKVRFFAQARPLMERGITKFKDLRRELRPWCSREAMRCSDSRMQRWITELGEIVRADRQRSSSGEKFAIAEQQ